MRSDPPPPRLPGLLLLGALELALLPLRLTLRIAGGLLLLIAAIGVPAWLIQLAISLLGGGGGGAPLPAWAMLSLLAAALPAGILAFAAASIPGPLRRGRRDRASPRATGHAADGGSENPDAEVQPTDPDGHEPADGAESLAWAYRTLELDPGATNAEIKAAYRRLAQRYHPDHNPGFTLEAAKRFAAITDAYELLLDHRHVEQPACGARA